MPVSQLRVGFRPLRIGFLVRPRSTGDLAAAARLSWLLWGGQFNPMISHVGDEASVDREIDALWVDALLYETPGAIGPPTIERHRELRWPLLPGRTLIQDDQRDGPHLRAMDVSAALSAFERWWRDERPAMPAVRVVWEADDEYALVYALTYGDFSRAGELLQEDLLSRFVRITGAADVHPTQGVAGDDAFDIRHVGAWSLSWRKSLSEREEVAVFIGNPRSAQDLIAYWNLRACAVPAIFWDRTREGDGQPFSTILQRRLDRVRQVEEDRLTRANGGDRPTWISCYSRDADPRSPLPAALVGVLGTDFVGIRNRVRAEEGWSPWRHIMFFEPPATSAETVLANVDDRGELLGPNAA